MRSLLLVLLTLPLLLTVPAAPAHDTSIQWDVSCFDNTPTSPGLAKVHTHEVGSRVGEIHVSEDRLIVSRSGDGGFRILSLANPQSPSHVRTFGTSGTTLDVKTSTDGDTVFVGTFDRIHIVNIANPSSPVHVRSVNLPLFGQDQAHMLYVSVIAGKEYLFAASQTGSGVYIYEVTGTAATRNLAHRDTFAPGSPLAAHDMYVHHDPVLGKHILYVANGFAGWLAADVSDPADPVPLAVVPNPDAGQSYLHSVQVEWVEGRRLVSTISELGANMLRVWDASVLAAPILLAEWSVQSDLGVVPSASSQHNIQMVDGRLYTAHYRCGFWVFDLRTLPGLPDLTGLQPVAHFAPVNSMGQHWDIVLRNGYIYTSDMRLGNPGAVHTVTYSGITQGDTAQTSTG